MIALLPLCVCVPVLECVVRTCKISSMYNFQACDAIFLTVVTMMYTKLSELIYLITGSLYPLTSTCPFFPAPSTSGDVHSTLFLSVIEVSLGLLGADPSSMSFALPPL